MGSADYRFRLINNLSPGDVLVMSAAIESLHLTYPGEYETAIRTSCDSIYDHNPRISRLTDDGLKPVEMHYDLINNSNQICSHFMHGYVEHLAKIIDRPLTLRVNRPQLYFHPNEINWLPRLHELGIRSRYWVINAGTKKDYTTKHWGHDNYQKVVDLLCGKILFVQIGSAEHNHRPLRGVINEIGKTDTRQLLRLCYHAQGGLGPTTFIQHVFAALNKPYVCILGGREPVPWVTYQKQTTLHTVGAMPCCANGGCWKARTVALADNSPHNSSLCEQPVFTATDTIPRCMVLITPEQVVAAIERYYLGGALSY